MIKKRLPTWLGLFALCCVSASYAADTAPLPAGSLIKRLTPEATITAKLAQAFPQYPITAVRPSPIEGLYLVKIGGSDINAATRPQNSLTLKCRSTTHQAEPDRKSVV